VFRSAKGSQAANSAGGERRWGGKSDPKAGVMTADFIWGSLEGFKQRGNDRSIDLQFQNTCLPQCESGEGHGVPVSRP
jgi:hypothetical protein